MDLTARIRRRTRTDGSRSLVADLEAISPVAHLPDPVGRGPVLERLLDHLEPALDGELPPDAYLWGPKGAGKSAVATALVAALQRELSEPGAVIHTSTRTDAPARPQFVSVDARTARTEAGLYRAVLAGVTDEAVPRRGIGTAALRDRLEATLAESAPGAVVVIDHVSDPDTPDRRAIRDSLAPVAASLSLVTVGRDHPATVEGPVPDARIEVPAYSRHGLVDVLTGRAAEGLADRALSHEATRRIADWSGGDAHDALAGLLGAVATAERRGHATIQAADLTAGLGAVPRPCRSLGRVVALSANRRRVVRALLELDEDQRASVSAATDGVARIVDLSPGTIRRFLYELAASGVLERGDSAADGGGEGRPPSRIEPRFPTIAFQRLADGDTSPSTPA